MSHSFHSFRTSDQKARDASCSPSFSHENKNHLAIINESAGLVHDLLSLPGSSLGEREEKIAKMAALIAERVEKANQLTRFLSRFAHRLDSPVCMFSVNEAIEEELALLEKIARRYKINFTTCFNDRLPAVYNRPALLQFAFYKLLIPFFSVLEKDSTIVVATDFAESTLSISAFSQKNPAFVPTSFSPWPREEVVEMALARLMATIQAPEAQHGLGFELHLTSLP